MDTLKGKRARQPEDKGRRLEAILAVAEKFLEKEGRKLPSAAEIARKAGLAKGTLYLYFRSKEEIYLELLKRKLSHWIEFQKEVLARPEITLDDYIQQYVKYCEKHSSMLFLAGLLNSILEQNVEAPIVYNFKKHMAASIGTGGELVVERFGIKQPLATKLYLYSYFMAVGLWQHTHPNQKILKIFEKEGVANLKLDFGESLTDSLTSLWRGSLIRQ